MTVTAVIVDDSAAIRAATRTILMVAGVKIIGEGGTADEAVTLCRTLRPDLVFLDVEMPGKSGLQVLPMIHCPVVLLSTARKLAVPVPRDKAVFVDKQTLASVNFGKVVQDALRLKK